MNALLYERLVGLVYEAVTDDSAWLAMISMLDGQLGMLGGHLALIDAELQDPHLVFSCMHAEGAPVPELEAEYVREYFPVDERVSRLIDFPIGEPIHNRMLLSGDEIRRTSAVYNEFLARVGGTNQVCVRLGGTGGSHDAWILTRRGSKDLDPDETGLVRRLAAHVGRMVRTRRALVGAGALGLAATEMLGRANAGVVLLDGAGRITERNARAGYLFSADGCLTDHGGVLAARSRAADQELRAAIRLASSASIPPRASTVIVPWPGRDRRVWVHVSPIGGEPLGTLRDEVEALAVVRDPWATPQLDPVIIRDVLDISEAEAEVVALLAQGRTTHQIAELRHRSVESVRWHLKRVYEKTGLHRQADVVRVALAAALDV